MILLPLTEKRIQVPLHFIPVTSDGALIQLITFWANTFSKTAMKTPENSHRYYFNVLIVDLEQDILAQLLVSVTISKILIKVSEE